MDYEPIVSQSDRYLHSHPGRRIPGFRDGWLDSLIWHISKMSKAQKAGALAVLYSLQANALPGAYVRSVSIAEFQDAIQKAIHELTQDGR